MPFKPGTHFLYNTSATYMQSAIVQKVTGQTVLEYLQPRLFGPLGIENPTWETSPQGISTGGYGLSVRTEDIAKFGQLYLQRGKWQGRQLVPEAWVDRATARQTSNGSRPESDWDQGYGYQFWRCRHGAYRGDGAFGQYCVVMPEQDAVVAITSGLKNMQQVLDLVWEKLLPAFGSQALAKADGDCQQLVGKLNNLAVRRPTESGEAKPVFGQKYVFPANDLKLESLVLERAGDGASEPVDLVAHVDGQEQRIRCGRGQWEDSQAAWGSLARNRWRPAGAGRTKDSPRSYVSTRPRSPSRCG